MVYQKGLTSIFQNSLIPLQIREEMRKIKIGNNEFDSKIKAMEFYKNILNSYSVGDSLEEDDFESIFNLVYIDFENLEEIKAYEEKTGDYLKSIVVDYHPELKNIKYFFLIGGLSEKQVFSYRTVINELDTKKFGIVIGDKEFGSKTKAIEFYKNILNSYNFKDTLNPDDFESVVSLVYINFDKDEIRAYEEAKDCIKAIIVDRNPNFRTTKCFFIIGDNNQKEIFSYRLAINGNLSDGEHFNRACRFVIEPRLREFKKQIFESRPVRCAITNEIVEWEECQIDHKSPLTFSVIIKSFIVANKIDVSSIEYSYDGSKEKFTDQKLAEKFDFFHKEMAVLRVLSTKQNNKLAAGARIKPSGKDGTLV